MDSLFYKYSHKKRVPITYLFLELFSKSIENSGEDAQFGDTLAPVLKALGYRPDNAMLEQVADDFLEFQKTRDIAKDTKPKKKGKRSFGDEFIKWFSGLDLERSLLLVSGFDWEKASHLYCSVPVEAVEKMVITYYEREWTQAEVAFESVLMGMGGEIKPSKSEDKSFEQPKTKEEEQDMYAQLKKIGF